MSLGRSTRTCTAFDYSAESDIYDALKRSVSGPMLRSSTRRSTAG